MAAVVSFARFWTKCHRMVQPHFNSVSLRCLSTVYQETSSRSDIRSGVLPPGLLSEIVSKQRLQHDARPNARKLTADQPSVLSSFQPSQLEYHLPTVWYNIVMKKSIIDPLTGLRAYELPTLYGNVGPKEMPAGYNISTPVSDPQTSPIADVVMLPYLMTIRHKKMKKHQLKKLRKRMKFVLRRRRAEKRKRRERQILEYEQKMAKEGADYDAEKFIEEQLLKARSAGWGIDIVAEFSKKNSISETDKRS